MKVAGYVRLSRDEDKESYSSILSQKSIIEEYAVQQGWKIEKFYEDDNCSGYTFERPAFSELIHDMENGMIDIVIAKDLSRIGRHNAYTLLFLERIKSMNKRLILPREGRGYDTLEDDSDLLGITTWYNEMYVKDISRKIKSSIQTKQKDGRMIIKEVFGYKKSTEDKHKLIIDLEAAAIVQRIFKLYLSGIGYRKIADCLNREGCPTPSQYQAYKDGAALGKAKTASKWNSVHVQRILKNDIYAGILRLGKTTKATIRGKSQKQPDALQHKFLNRHPAIISMDQFAEVQRIAHKRKNDYTKGAASLGNVFSGLLYCQGCGSYMIAYKKAGKPNSYICGNYHKHGRKSCQRHTIREDLLLQALQEFLKVLAITCQTELYSLSLEKNNRISLDSQALISKLVQEQQRVKGQLKLVIYQKLSEQTKQPNDAYHKIKLESLDELEEELKQRIFYLEKSIKDQEKMMTYEDREVQNSAFGIMEQMMYDSSIKKKYLENIFDKILIAEDGTPTIYLKTNIETICVHNRVDMTAY